MPWPPGRNSGSGEAVMKSNGAYCASTGGKCAWPPARQASLRARWPAGGGAPGRAAAWAPGSGDPAGAVQLIHVVECLPLTMPGAVQIVGGDLAGVQEDLGEFGHPRPQFRFDVGADEL